MNTISTQNDLLLLFHAHKNGTGSAHVHRVELEAYTRFTMMFSPDPDLGTVRTAVSEMLLTLRNGSFVWLDERGFSLTSKGVAVVSSLLAEEETAIKLQLMDHVVELVHTVWELQAEKLEKLRDSSVMDVETVTTVIHQ